MSGINLIEFQFRRPAVDPVLMTGNAAQLHTFRANDPHRHALCGDGQCTAQFLLEDQRQVAAVFDKIEVAVRILRQRGHQILVVVAADADGADRNPFPGQTASQTAEFKGTGRPDIGQAIRQQQQTVHPAGLHPELAEFGGSQRHPGKQRRTGTGDDRIDLLRNPPPVLLRHRSRRHQHFRRIVIDDQSKPVPVGKHIQCVFRRQFCIFQLAHSRHRPRTIQRNCQIHPRTFFFVSSLPRRSRN